MHDATDMDLLRQYAAGNADPAFAELVSRHINLVYSAALRKTGNPHAAEEITQAVFIILAQKVGRIPDQTILPGWLYQTARLAAASFLKREGRRVRREQEAYMQTELHAATPDETWQQLAPLLDDAMGQLGEIDRAAVVLRFFGGKSFAEVGRAAGVSENAAKKRVNRALEKLHRYFNRRGVGSTTAIIAGAISANSVQAAPVALAKSVTGVALTKGAAASGSTLTLIKGALKIMAWTKMKAVIITSAVVLLAAGTTTITVKEIQEHRTYPWQGQEGVINSNDLNQPPQVKIVPSRFHKPGLYTGDKLLGKGLPVQTVIANAYGYATSARAVFSVKLPAGLYDYIACLLGGEAANEMALQSAVKRKFGVAGKTETRETDVWVLKVKHPNVPNLKLNQKDGDRGNGFFPDAKTGKFRGWNEQMPGVAASLEYLANTPIIDETGLTNRFDFDLNCQQTDVENKNWDSVNLALDKLGLELVPTNMPIEMLVVEKAN